MSYFNDGYEHVKYPAGANGLRRAQTGAIFAIASHFTTREDAAIVVLPTGCGKTAVLMMAPFVLKARRCLIITPSRVVRNQIAEDFAVLKTLKKISVFGLEMKTPKVEEVASTISDKSQWWEFESSDVVVVSPNSASPEIEAVAPPPPELFDLILVDEAHHSRARTWEGLLNSFPGAKQILFTATPFRRDQRQLHGKLVYNYPVSLAVEDKIFGEIEYVAVDEVGGDADDVRIARIAEETLRQDRANDLDHLLMVRTDSRARAKELKKIYEENTGLELQLIHGEQSFPYIRKALEKLRAKQLDGVICVDMLGEGFDLPELKIAAIHAPHKSLPATLQFIGRFARTNASKIGKAKFLAIPSTVEGALDRLYVEGADWQKLVIELTETRIEKEVRVREIIEGFDTATFVEPDFENVSLFSLRPYHHVKVFKVTGDVDLESDLSPLLNPVFRRPNHEMSADLFITRDLSKPKWSISDEFIGYQFNLFIVYHDAKTNLLFISASEKSPLTYEAIAQSYTRGIAYPLPLDKVDKVLSELEDFDFWNIGMRNKFAKNNTESYRIMAGESPEKSIHRSDARIFHRGHLFGTARENGNKVTIGYSSLSKVWSHQYESVASLIAWCQKLATRIDKNGIVKTYSAIDFLSVGKTVSKIPAGPVGLGWHEVVYKSPPLVRYEYDGKIIEDRHLLDFALTLDLDTSSADVLRFEIEDENICCSFDFSLTTSPRLVQVSGSATNFFIIKGLREISLFEFLSLFPVTFFFADFSSLCVDQHYAYGDIEIAPFDGDSQMTAVDWDAAGVDIRREVKSSVSGKTIQEYYSEQLRDGDDDVVFIDDSSGEIADFVSFRLSPDVITVRFYHCKKAHGVNAVLRDAYDVCGQLLTSLVWVNNRGLLDQILYREKNTIKSRFLKGDRDQLRELLKKSRTITTRYEIVIVQPGFRKGDLSDEIAHILASADDYIRSALCEPLQIICRA